jgi:7-keto-8-aminopelargonate synthetase-like enzyme
MSESKAKARMGLSDRLRVIAAAATQLESGGLLNRVAEDERLDGRTITLDGQRLVNFGNCSYLGLETDARLKAAACEAILRFGTQFSSSRTYISAPLYREFELIVSRMVGGLPVVITPTTSLGHLAALPVLVNERDAVLYDTYVHNSVQAVVPTLREHGVHCEMVPHYDFSHLEGRVRELSRDHERVFYLCDGVSSMQGDTLDTDELFALLDRLPALWAYVDDAHGVGWAGKHGTGTVLGARGIHPRSIVTLGFAKAFASAGCAIVAADPELTERILTCGSTMIFSGPMQPAQIGAGIAAAKIFLSDELPELQRQVRERIVTFDAGAAREGLNVVAQSASPIRFVEIGPEQAAVELGAKLRAAGFFVNCAVCPAVPRRHAGIRIVLNRQQTLDDVRELTRAIGRLQSEARTGKRPATAAMA